MQTEPALTGIESIDPLARLGPLQRAADENARTFGPWHDATVTARTAHERIKAECERRGVLRGAI